MPVDVADTLVIDVTRGQSITRQLATRLYIGYIYIYACVGVYALEFDTNRLLI